MLNCVGDIACCHFLQFGSCDHGDRCTFKHFAADPATTTCGYGMTCPYWHGFERRKEGRVLSSNERDDQSKFDGVGNVCCHFLQDGVCSHGDGCKFQHILCDPDTTRCGYGNNCKNWHGWKSFNEQESWYQEDPQSWSHSDNANACCDFLQYGECSYGEDCTFKHVTGDPASTMCSYGQYCMHWHGWSADPTTSDQKNSKDKWVVKGTSVSVDKAKQEGDERNRRTKGACCDFLEWGSCTRGEKCRYDHARGNKKTTKCGFGHNCQYGHGFGNHWSSGTWGGKAAKEVDAPNKLLRAALNSLLGKWHSRDSANRVLNHDIILNISPSSPGAAELSCCTVGPGGVEKVKPVKFVNGDIVLGKQGEFYLEVSSDRHVVWINSEYTQKKCKWTRGPLVVDVQSEEDSCAVVDDNVLRRFQ